MSRLSYFFFGVQRGYVYTFVAGIWLSTGINLGTTVLLTDQIKRDLPATWTASSLCIIGSILSFVIGSILDKARQNASAQKALIDQEQINEAYLRDVLPWKSLGFLWFLFMLSLLPVAGLLNLLKF